MPAQFQNNVTFRDYEKEIAEKQEIEEMAKVIKNTLVVLPSESELIAHGFGMPTQQDEGAYKLRIFDREDYIRKQIATALRNAGYRKQSKTVKEFAKKAEQRLIEDSKWLDIMLKGYDCKDSEDYDAVANAIIRGRFVNKLNDLATEYGKED